jgi:hypothetical protein
MSSPHTEDSLVILARIEENLSILEMAKTHMDERAVLVIQARVDQLHNYLLRKRTTKRFA